MTALAGAIDAARTPIPPSTWSERESRPILAKTLKIRLDPDLSRLTPGERMTVDRLLEVGRIVEDLYERSNHHQARAAYRRLVETDKRLGSPSSTQNLLDLYRLFQGPIATTLDNRRLPFVTVDSLVPGKAVYPWGVTKDAIDRFLASHPEQKHAIFHPRTVVRRATAASIRADLATLAHHPGLELFHPSLGAELRALLRRPSPDRFYAMPYPVAYADDMVRASRLIREAASHAEVDDPDFARYLRHRARDLLANDYEAGDAAWVLGRFGKLNVQLGAYETYDDELYGVKAFHSVSVLLADERETAALRQGLRDLQKLENSLPYTGHKKLKDEISVGIYDVIADFGQARGTNTASILPNETEIVRRYGRTILMRRNLLMHPELQASARDVWRAALDPRHQEDFQPDGTFYRVLWHEIGHYLGPDRDANGRELDIALEEESGTFEEMKADLVGLFVARALREQGYYDDRKLRGVYASGIGRMLNKTKPRRDQVYGTMQLMQLNWFLDHGALEIDRGAAKLRIRYERYHDAVAGLLEQALKIQQSGDKPAANRFIERWAVWDDRHEAIAKAMRDTERSRFRLVRYAALGE